MPTLVMIDTADDANAPSALFQGMGNYSGWRARENLWLATIQSDAHTVRTKMPSYKGRVGIGAREIWDNFSEYRSEFVAQVTRATPNGPQPIERPLKYAIAGDRRIGKSLKLYNSAFIDPIPNISTASETIFAELAELGRFSFIDKTVTLAHISVLNKFIYFVDNFSLLKAENVEILSGVRFLSADHLLNHSDFVQLLMAANQTRPGIAVRQSKPKMPQQFTGAFIFETDNADYAAAINARLLGAAALGGSGYGKVPRIIRLKSNGWEAKSGEEFANRPYIDYADVYTISLIDEPLAKIVSLLKTSDLNKFIKAKEDFRLLALDTIEDSRRSDVPVLRFSQIWMAIERLIPFKTETTAQLSLALTAMEPLISRFEKFKLLKKSYGLRSQIVHGYSFEKGNHVHIETNEMARLFRKLFLISLRLNNSDELKDLLLSHVIGGKPEAL